MSKKKTTKAEVIETEVVAIETPVVETVEIAPNVVAEVKKKPGRPVVENSARQMRLTARAARFVDGEVKRGRPSNPSSARQSKLTARAEALANGVAIKRGRPKMEKPVEATAVEAVA